MGTRGCHGVRGEASCRPSEARVRNAAPASGGSHVFHIPRWRACPMRRASPVWRASPEVSGSAPLGCARITHFDLGVVVRPPTSAFRRAAGEVGCCKAPPGERTTHLGPAVATCHPLQTCGGILSAHIVTFAREARGGFLSSAQSDPSAGSRWTVGLAFGGEGVQDGPCSGIHASRHGHAANPRAAHAVAPGMARQAFRQGERDGSPRPQGGAPWTSVLVTVDHAISERGRLLAPLPRRV